MLCPNCKTELINVNGRYICSDCGKEVPEAEVNVGDWGQGSFEGEKVIPEPGEVNVSNSIENTEEADSTFVVDEKPMVVDSATSPDLGGEISAGEPLADTTPPVETEQNQDTEAEKSVALEEQENQPEDGFYEPKSTGDIDLNSLKEHLSETLTFDTKASIEPAAKSEVSQPEPTVDPMPTTSRENNVAPVEESSSDEVETTSDIDGAESMPQNKKTLPNTTESLPADPEIYEDPLYENDVAETVSKESKAETKVMPVDKKKIIILSSVGGFLVLTLLLGGLFAYKQITKEVNPTISGLPAINTVVDCDSADDREYCLAENFADCKPASWTSDYTLPAGDETLMKYEIRGSVDNQCEIQLTDDHTGQSMVCALDNSLDINTAFRGMDEMTCSGKLTSSAL